MVACEKNCRNGFTVKEPVSALTHFIGIVYSALLSPFLMSRAFYRNADTVTLVSLAVFLISMVLLYTASTVYHTVSCCPMLFKKLDHSMIFVLIAGTYTPVCLIALRNGMGPKLLAFVWTFALAGIVFKLIWVTCPKWVSSVIYVSMGWSCIAAMPAIVGALSAPALFFLVTGGVIYTIGGIIYAMKLSAFNTRNPLFGSHEIFHLFVMAGNLCHFVSVWMMI